VSINNSQNFLKKTGFFRLFLLGDLYSRSKAVHCHFEGNEYDFRELPSHFSGFIFSDVLFFGIVDVWGFLRPPLGRRQ